MDDFDNIFRGVLYAEINSSREAQIIIAKALVFIAEQLAKINEYGIEVYTKEG